MPRSAKLQHAYAEACLAELRALKPGNVHLGSEGHGMTVAQFETSARVSAPPLCARSRPVGVRIRDAIAATRAAVGCNTNLGIVLLAAPLIAATQRADPGGLRKELVATLASLSVADAAAAYEAIRLAEPAGLGRVAEQDVAAPPTMGLRQVMVLAAERDLIARQYANGYRDVFAIGVQRVVAARREGHAAEWGATLAYMAFLAAFPDSHVARKFGAAAAESVRAEAASLAAELKHGPEHKRLTTALIRFDDRLKASGLNPGSSADLTVASLLALACEDMLDCDSPAHGSQHPAGRDQHKRRKRE